ncbi:MAG TPA: hypothetical protein VGM30_10480 [Puia sp.]|jgi:hypothetical protein
MKLGIFGYEDTCVKAYDPIHQQLVGIFDNYNDAGNKLGIVPSIVQKTCSRKGKAYSEILKIKVSIRLSRKMKKEELIAEIIKFDYKKCPKMYVVRSITADAWDLEKLGKLANLTLHDIWRELRHIL